jgi:hypothetical protein
MKKCCPELRAHTGATGKNGIRVSLVPGPNLSFVAYIEFRSPETPTLNSFDIGTEIEFCPWCGVQLVMQYGSEAVISAPEAKYQPPRTLAAAAQFRARLGTSQDRKTSR